ncbi:fatty acid-binding protein, muscle-like [Halyomorpha halys]|uniref:fatty acid-binding protein, muscle-like n=1 Tax=Halyomorpha halys TaxID=286706 RepID=UPI0006D4E79F|nr:fatty acid-binding protein, muscle-like [Halyomorpha halys]
MGLSDFCGIKYKLDKSERFDEFMKCLGVSMLTRKMGNAVSPVVEMTENDGEYTISSSSTFKNSIIKFKLGQEFDEDTPDGRKVKSIITQDGDNKLIQIQKGDKESKIIREFAKDQILMTLSVDDVVCIRTYKALS